MQKPQHLQRRELPEALGQAAELDLLEAQRPQSRELAKIPVQFAERVVLQP